MAFSVKDPETDAAVRRLAALKGKGLTETILDAVEREHRRLQAEIPMGEGIAQLIAELKTYPRTGLKADKAFFDELSGDT